MIEPPAGATLVTDPEVLDEFYRDVPGAHIYALGDLDEPFWSASRWYRRGDAVVGVVSLSDEDQLAVYAVSTRDPAGSLDLLAELAPHLPSGQLITGPVGLAERLGPLRSLAWAGPHLRHVLGDLGAVPGPDPRVQPLGAEDLAGLVELYGTDPGAAFFMAHMVDDDSYVGVFRDGVLVAAAGTHVLSLARRVAAIGAVLVRPSHRGQGLGRAVTTGVIHRIADRVDTIGLNVASENTPARRIYESLGFSPILEYAEAELA